MWVDVFYEDRINALIFFNEAHFDHGCTGLFLVDFIHLLQVGSFSSSPKASYFIRDNIIIENSFFYQRKEKLLKDHINPFINNNTAAVINSLGLFSKRECEIISRVSADYSCISKREYIIKNLVDEFCVENKIIPELILKNCDFSDGEKTEQFLIQKIMMNQE
jgi:hypothetical protein